MNSYGDVYFDTIVKDEWCDLAVLGSIADKTRVELAIYYEKGKMGVMHLTQDNYRDEGYCFCEEFVPCDYDEISFMRTTDGTYLLVTKNGKQGIIALSAFDNMGYKHVFYQELFPCVYDEIRYIGGYPSYFLLREGNVTMKYNFMTKEMKLEMGSQK